MQAQKDVINLNFIRGFSTNKLILLYDVPEKYLKNNKCCKAQARQVKGNRKNRYGVIKVMKINREGDGFPLVCENQRIYQAF
jgi:hypothetical protein